MNKMITIRATEFAEAKSGNKYLKVHGSDDKTYSIFQEGLWNLFNEGFAVELTLEKNEKGYWNVTDAKSVAQELAEKLMESKPIEPGIRENMEWKDHQIEQKFWWGQLGECLRTKEIDKATPQGKLLRAAYYAQMFQVLNLKIKKEES